MTRFLLILWVVLGLSACENTEQLQAQNKQLREQLANQAASKQAELESIERQVSFAAACDYGFPVCPDSFLPAVKTWRKKLKEETFPTGSLFWWLVLVKFGVLAGICGAFLGSLGWAWLKISQPTARRLLAAESQLAHKKTELASIEIEIKAANAKEAKTVSQVLEQAQARLAQLERDIERATKKRTENEVAAFASMEELVKLEAAIELAKKEKELLSVFGSSIRR
jgi:exonuclease VII large subunit